MNILFTGIGGPTPIGLARSIKMIWPNYRCIGVDASSWAPSLYESQLFLSTYKVPSANDVGYWEAIDKIVQKEKIDFAFVVPETEVLVWAKRETTHALPCRVHLPSWKLADFCFDKLKVAEILFPKGLTPRTEQVELNESSLAENINLDYPYWIRVKAGAGALGALRINSKKDLTTWLTIHSNRPDFIASEFLPGRNYACKMLYHHGKLVQSGSAERIDYLLSAAAPSGISGMCSRGRLLNRQDLVALSTEALEYIAEHLNTPLHGMFTVDFKENREGKPLITEINIRHVSFTEAFALGKINFSESTLRLHFEQGFVKASNNHFQSEDYFIRGVDAPLRLVSKEKIK